MNRQETIKAYAAWGAVCLFWGTTYLVIRIGVQRVPPALFAGLRFIIAGVLFLAYLRWRGYPMPKRREWLHMAIVGISLLVMANGLVVWAEQWVPSGLTAVIIATLPFWSAGIEAALPSGERMTLRKVVGILIGFAGVIILFAPEMGESLDKAYLKGVIVLIFVPFFWSVGSIYSKHHPVECPPLVAAGTQTLIAGLVLTAIGTIFGEWSEFALDWEGMAAIGYLIVFGSIVGYGSFIYALSKLPITTVSMYAYINPVIAVILGWLILDERLDWFVATATTVVLLGVALVKSAKA
ncbi:MAG: EamA family transporter [Desulfatiglandales bacterium]